MTMNGELGKRTADVPEAIMADIEEKCVDSLVDVVLKMAMNETWLEKYALWQAETTRDQQLPNNPQFKKKSKMSQARKLFCLERKVQGREDWKIVEFSQGDRVKTSDGSALLKTEGTPKEDTAQCKTTPSPPSTRQPGPGERDRQTEYGRIIRRQVGLYIQDVIQKALEQICDERAGDQRDVPSHHLLLFRAPSTDDVPLTTYPPTTRADRMSEHQAISTDNMGGMTPTDSTIEDVVALALRMAVEGARRDVARHSKTPANSPRDNPYTDTLGRHEGTADVAQTAGNDDTEKLGTSQRIPTFSSVKRLLGLRRRTYVLHHDRPESELPTDTAHEAVAGTKPIRDENALTQEAEENVIVKDFQNTDNGVALKRTKPFSRRIFNRIFGSRQQYSPHAHDVADSAEPQ